MLGFGIKIRGLLRRKLQQIKQRDIDRTNEINSFKLGKNPNVSILSKTKSINKINVFYPLIYPYAYARIKLSEDKKELKYFVEEPILEEQEIEIYNTIKDALIKTIDININDLKTNEDKISYLKKKINDILVEFGISLKSGQYIRLLYTIYVNFVGLGKIEPLMNDPYIEDISCDGINISIYIAHKKYGNLQTNVEYKDESELKSFIIKLAERCERYVSYAEPVLDASLPDGSRVNAMLSEDISTHGPTYTIRKFRHIPFSIIDLIQNKTIPINIGAFLWFVIEHKQNILICGGTSAGKTSLLNSFVLFIPPEYKIISIEDTRELNLLHKNWVPNVSRTGFGQIDAYGRKYGGITMFDLLKESFRQNPDYIIIGEVRGKEASVLFQGMASGHPSFGTMHGGSIQEIIQRLQSPPINLSNTMVQILDYVILITRATKFGKSARRLKEINFIEKIERDGNVIFRMPYKWDAKKDEFIESEESVFICLDKITEEYGINKDKCIEEIKSREKYLKYLLNKKITSFEEVHNKIQEYYNKKYAFGS
ncbi:MAG: type IV secretion system protein VirB11 [Candidatus Aenigmarchaeota archaeon ex4484_52]|nr:MAG: type IV secretion system protein VirB11 [Candidatus Aenigmarchaeota archaeon ex4484_52]